MENLEKLNLFGNDLKKLEPKLFAGFTKLKKLILDGNQVVFINGIVVTKDEFIRALQVFIPDINVKFDSF